MLWHNIKVKVAEETVSDHLCVTIKNCAHIMHDHNPLVSSIELCPLNKILVK